MATPYNVLRDLAEWWERDRVQTTAMRLLVLGLFVGGVVLGVYANQEEVPTWVFVVYANTVIALNYSMFMYAIKRNGEEEFQRSAYDLRKTHLQGWRFEREMLAEFVRFSLCTASGINPSRQNASNNAPGGNLTLARRPWPAVDANREICRYVRDDLEKMLDPPSSQEPDRNASILTLDLIAYSSETFVNLSRQICCEIADVMEAHAKTPSMRVSVRVLVRETSERANWLVPVTTDREADRTYATELRTRFTNVRRSTLTEFRKSLRRLFQSANVDFQVRSYQTEPLLKGVIVGRRRGIFGIYTIDDLTWPSGYDYSGHAVTMSLCDEGGNAVQATAAHFLTRLFDELWDSDELSRPINN